MSGSSSFTFGIRNYFTFTFGFQVGKPPHNPTIAIPEAKVTLKDNPDKITTKPASKIENEPSRKTISKEPRTVAVESACEVATKPTAAETIGCTEGPEQPKSPVIVKTICPLLDTIPPEIRCMIYDLLLVSADSINTEQANKLLGHSKSLLLSYHDPIPNISAALLRTCRAIYEEALPILYGRNVFEFSDPDAIDEFRDSGIASYPYVFGLRKNEPQGRLTLLCSVNLTFVPPTNFEGRIYDFGTTRSPIDGLREWTRKFFNCGRYNLRFPALQNLTLDFLAMKFDKNEGLRVDPIVRRLAPAGGLQKVMVKGIKHEETLQELRARLVKAKGIFLVENIGHNGMVSLRCIP